ncbi:MAG: DNA translocase FtsK 4TM domain-containing protein, partial [Proteobacteria bacterium]|nr:DNA translocase FtsK 4TM domain-containing protein [Pseudomonadota bacterium]
MRDTQSAKNPVKLWESLGKIRLIRPEDGYSQELILLFTLIVSCFVLASLTSFSPYDPSSYNFSFPPRAPHNWGGMLGSSLAASLVYQFGVLAYFLPFPWLWMSFALVLGQTDAFRWARLGGWVLVLLSLLLATHSWSPELSIEGLKYPPAGAVGFYLGRGILHVLGQAGCLITILAGGFLGILMIRRQAILKPFLEAQRNQWLSRRQLKMEA